MNVALSVPFSSVIPLVSAVRVSPTLGTPVMAGRPTASWFSSLKIPVMANINLNSVGSSAAWLRGLLPDWSSLPVSTSVCPRALETPFLVLAVPSLSEPVQYSWFRSVTGSPCQSRGWSSFCQLPS